MGSDKPRYFVKIKGCYYWRPTPRMKRVGFQDRALGKCELAAKQEAMRLNAEWDRFRFGEPQQPNIMIYPPGSLGHAYNRAIALREAERKAKTRHRLDARTEGARRLAPGMAVDRSRVWRLRSACRRFRRPVSPAQ